MTILTLISIYKDTYIYINNNNNNNNNNNKVYKCFHRKSRS